MSYVGRIRFRATREIKGDVRKAFDKFKDEMKTDVALDRISVARFSDDMTRAVRMVIGELASGHISIFVHIINGYGNFTSESKSAREMIAKRANNSDRACIVQDKENDGDYHPWQLFAYSIMAGISPDDEVPDTGATLRTMALNSRDMSVSRPIGMEAGHLLFAAAHLTPDPNLEVIVNGNKMRLRKIANEGLRAHAEIGLDQLTVCEHTHLAEGLAVVAVKVPGMDSIREVIQELLSIHFEKLILIGAMIKEGDSNSEGNEDAFNEMRKTLRFDGRFAYAAITIGHLLELVAFAEIFGYKITTEQRNAAKYVANICSEKLFNGMSSHIQGVDIIKLSHYRRAITLLDEIEAARTEGRPLSTVDFTKYKVNFDGEEKGIVTDSGLVIPSIADVARYGQYAE